MRRSKRTTNRKAEEEEEEEEEDNDNLKEEKTENDKIKENKENDKNDETETIFILTTLVDIYCLEVKMQCFGQIWAKMVNCRIFSGVCRSYIVRRYTCQNTHHRLAKT